MTYYKLDCALLPDRLFNKSAGVKEWLALATTSKGKFLPAGSLNRVVPIDKDVELERIFSISLYVIGNVLPFALPLLIVGSLVSDVGMLLLKIVLVYVGVLFAVVRFVFMIPRFIEKYQRPNQLSDTGIRDNQYLYTERNNQKPESLQRPALDGQPLFNDKVCHWTCAPVILKLPIIASFMKRIGYIPAKSKNILETLTNKKEESVGVILDGVAGMFHSHDEVAYIKRRKGIIKIALRSGVPIVPVFGFGHTSLWKVITDPFGILQKLSMKLDISLCPFFGRFGWFLGPPRRVAVCMCLGEPVRCPKIEGPTQADIDKYHGILVQNYIELFEEHKDAYGWGDKRLKIV